MIESQDNKSKTPPRYRREPPSQSQIQLSAKVKALEEESDTLRADNARLLKKVAAKMDEQDIRVNFLEISLLGQKTLLEAEKSLTQNLRNETQHLKSLEADIRHQYETVVKIVTNQLGANKKLEQELEELRTLLEVCEVENQQLSDSNAKATWENQVHKIALAASLKLLPALDKQATLRHLIEIAEAKLRGQRSQQQASEDNFHALETVDSDGEYERPSEPPKTPQRRCLGMDDYDSQNQLVTPHTPTRAPFTPPSMARKQQPRSAKSAAFEGGYYTGSASKWD